MIPTTVAKTMNKLVEALQARTTAIESIYLYGSTALHDYMEGSSDIDFIAVIRESADEADLDAIQQAHGEVAAAFPAVDLMGAYITKSALGKPPEHGQPMWTYFNGRFHTDGTGADLNPVTWWILRHKGIHVYGKTMQFGELPEGELTAYTLHNMNSYWAGWVTRVEQQAALCEQNGSTIEEQQLDTALEWCALGMLRQWYTLREQSVISKVNAGHYGLSFMPERFHAVIYEAIAIKQRKPERYYRNQYDRLADLAAMLRFIMEEANTH